jgi:type II secretory pathway pseudopilin PulG
MLTKIFRTQWGFSIIEVIIFIGILSVVLTAALGFTIRMILTVRINEHRLRAGHYVEEVKEWLDGEREADWEEFESFSSIDGTAYCINEPLIITDSLATFTPGPCTSNGLTPPIYQRLLTLTKDTPDIATRVTATIQVTWVEEGASYVEQIQTLYSIWE